MRISDWSSDVCSSDLECPEHVVGHDVQGLRNVVRTAALMFDEHRGAVDQDVEIVDRGEAIFRVGRNMDGNFSVRTDIVDRLQALALGQGKERSEEHTSELQSLMRISYAVFCLKKKRNKNNNTAQQVYI